MTTSRAGVRRLVIVLGDQLSRTSSAFDDFDPERDVVWMAECAHEIDYVWSHKLRIAAFLSAMRHFRDALTADGTRVWYHELTVDRTADRGASFEALLGLAIGELCPRELVVTQPGDHRVMEELHEVALRRGLQLIVREDRHFYCGLAEFDAWAGRRRMLTIV